MVTVSPSKRKKFIVNGETLKELDVKVWCSCKWYELCDGGGHGVILNLEEVEKKNKSMKLTVFLERKRKWFKTLECSSF